MRFRPSLAVPQFLLTLQCVLAASFGTNTAFGYLLGEGLARGGMRGKQQRGALRRQALVGAELPTSVTTGLCT